MCKKIELKYIIGIIIATVLWFFMFSKWTSYLINFWVTMPIAAVILISFSIYLNKKLKFDLKINYKDVIVGLGSAILLWFIFLAGDYFSNILFSFEESQVSSIYGMRMGHDSFILTLLLLFIIGPAEEIFWRGTIQKHLMKKINPWAGVIITTIIYSLVHLWSFNFMLIMAALVCGLFWGILFMYYKKLPALIISHALWDVAVFIWFPIL
ncbi:MAG: type II CAAX endopeptidase family protein [Bacteroidales bacterium]